MTKPLTLPLTRRERLTPLRLRLVDADRPRTRGDCENGPRPCHYAGCRHHLALDVTRIGTIRMPFGEGFEEAPETCSLDVADAGALNGEEVGRLLNVSRERVRQIEERAVSKLSRLVPGLREFGT